MPELLAGCGPYTSIGQYRQDASSIRTEEANIQALTKDMLTELMAVDPTLDPDTLEAGTHRWFLARMDYCTACCTRADQQLDELNYLRCLKWAAACRLERLLARYDSLTSQVEAPTSGTAIGPP